MRARLVNVTREAMAEMLRAAEPRLPADLRVLSSAATWTTLTFWVDSAEFPDYPEGCCRSLEAEIGTHTLRAQREKDSE